MKMLLFLISMNSGRCDSKTVKNLSEFIDVFGGSKYKSHRLQGEKLPQIAIRGSQFFKIVDIDIFICLFRFDFFLYVSDQQLSLFKHQRCLEFSILNVML